MKNYINIVMVIILHIVIFGGIVWYSTKAGHPEIPKGASVNNATWPEKNGEPFVLEGYKNVTCQSFYVIRGKLVNGKRWDEERNNQVIGRFVRCNDGFQAPMEHLNGKFGWQP